MEDLDITGHIDDKAAVYLHDVVCECKAGLRAWREKLLRVTSDRKTWRVIIANVVNGLDTQIKITS